MADLHAQLAKQKKLDWLFVNTTRFFAFLVLISLGAILISLIWSAWPSIQEYGFGFYTTQNWDAPNNKFGALAPIFGTVVTSVIAICIAVPVSFGIAMFLTELCPEFLKKPLGMAIELLAGIPSIIYGIWGYLVLSKIFADITPTISDTLKDLPLIGSFFEVIIVSGTGIFIASLVLAIMIIPFIAATMRDVFAVVPDLLKESAYGLGATRWEVMFKVVLPYTKTGVVGGVILGLGRALGETMAVTFLIGNIYNINFNFFASGVSITSAIANEFAESKGLHAASLLHLGLILFVITFIVLSISKIILARMDAKAGVKR